MLTVYEMYIKLYESFHHNVVCMDKDTGRYYAAPEELSVNFAEQPEYCARFIDCNEGDKDDK